MMKKINKLMVATFTSALIMTSMPNNVMAEELEDANNNENAKQEQAQPEAEASTNETPAPEVNNSENMTTTETQNDDGSVTTEYKYEEQVEAESLEQAIDIYNQKVAEQEAIKQEIQDQNGTYSYEVNINTEVTKTEQQEQFETQQEAESFAQQQNGTVSEVEQQPVEGQSAQQAGFTSEEEAQQWANQKAEELIEQQTSDTSEKVTASSEISIVEGTGIITEETKEIEEKTFDKETDAKEYAESFENAEYEITEVDGHMEYQKKTVTASNDDGTPLYFDNQDEVDDYIEENDLEGAYVETVELVNTQTQQVEDKVIITATSYEEFESKVRQLYEEVEGIENVSIKENLQETLETNYKTSINFETLSEEEKTALLNQMKEDAADQNFRYTHLDLMVESNIKIYDENGDEQQVNCKVKADSNLKVYIFAEIDGRMTKIEMQHNSVPDPNGYMEIMSKRRNLNLSKAYVLVEGNVEYEYNGNTYTKPFSTTGYMNNDNNPCKHKPDKNKNGHYKNNGGFDIGLSDFTLDKDGNVVVESTATKVYTVTVTKVTTNTTQTTEEKLIVKYQTDDLETGEYVCDYKVNGTYKEVTEIPAEYKAEVETQLANLLYKVDYTKTETSYNVVIDGEGNVTVVPEEPVVISEDSEEPVVTPETPENPDTTPESKPQEIKNDTEREENKSEQHVETTVETTVAPKQAEEVVYPCPVVPSLRLDKDVEEDEVAVEETNTVEFSIPKTGDTNTARTMQILAGFSLTMMLGAVAMMLKKIKK